MKIQERIGIKYCGGCNPAYERVEIIQRVRLQLGEQFLFVRHDEKDIFALISINGCSRACADQGLSQEIFYYSVTKENDMASLTNWLRALSEKGRF